MSFSVRSNPVDELLARPWRWIIGAALLGAPLVGYGVWYRFARHGTDAWQPILLGLIPIAYALWLAGNRSLARLARRPHEVVSIHERREDRNGRVVHALCFGFADGATAWVTLANPLITNPPLRAALVARFPSARLGAASDPRAMLPRATLHTKDLA